MELIIVSGDDTDVWHQLMRVNIVEIEVLGATTCQSVSHEEFDFFLAIFMAPLLALIEKFLAFCLVKLF